MVKSNKSASPTATLAWLGSVGCQCPLRLWVTKIQQQQQQQQLMKPTQKNNNK